MILSKDRAQSVQRSLEEDIGEGDITAELISEDTSAVAHLYVREDAVICGTEWVDEVFAQLPGQIKVDWHVKDGDKVIANTKLASFYGAARVILTGERCALNWMQTLSGVATQVNQFASLVDGFNTKILDTRKTIPGMRLAQKYAVTVGGGVNHRMGLYDAFLIKENHIMSSGSISQAITDARRLHNDKPIEIEVENLEEFDEATSAQPDVIMCDNFTLELLTEAVRRNSGQIKLEASGNVDETTVQKIAETGVDYISIGALTKHIRAIDLSLRFETSSYG